MNSLGEWQKRWMLGTVGGGAFVILLALELLTEEHGVSFAVVLLEALELLLIIVAAGGLILLVQRVHAHHEEKMALVRELTVARVEGEGWRQKVQTQLGGIRREIHSQFRDWDMTAAEQEIGLLILKGLSHKEIAGLRGTTEITVRQQAQAIYQKSRLPGKHAFFAYFLEDLFTPQVLADDS